MAKLSTYALAGAIAFALAPVAGYAADLPEPPLLEPSAPVEFGSAWYLRGDVGYKKYQNPDVSFKGYKYKGEDLNDTAVIGGGVGYKFNSWLRADVTVDYEFKSKFHGDLVCYFNNGPCPGNQTHKAGYSQEEAKIDAITPLVNVYADLGTWNGITPYVGAGIGASYLKVTDYKYKNPNGSRGDQPGNGVWDFSWALMAGLGYHVTDNLIIDTGYRYLNLGDAKSGKATGFGKGAKRIKFDDLEAHEVRVGFRYLID